MYVKSLLIGTDLEVCIWLIVLMHEHCHIILFNLRQQQCFPVYVEMLQATSNMLTENRPGPYFCQHVARKMKVTIKVTKH